MPFAGRRIATSWMGFMWVIVKEICEPSARVADIGALCNVDGSMWEQVMTSSLAQTKPVAKVSGVGVSVRIEWCAAR